VLRVGQRSVLIAAVARSENPQGVNAQGGAEREMDQRENRKDDREHAAPGLAREKGISGQNGAADTDENGESCYRPEIVQPHAAERAPSKGEVGMAEMAAKEAMQKQHAKQSHDRAKTCVNEPESAESLKVTRNPVIRRGHRSGHIGSRDWCLNGHLRTASRAKARILRQTIATC
jgi:hypothetical protein